MSSYAPTQTIRALQNVDNTTWFTQANVGLGTYRWYILALLGICVLALIITHVIVLSDEQKYLPLAGLQNLDSITIANLVFISFLIIATIGLFQSANVMFQSVKRDLKVNPDSTVFTDPVLDDLRNRIANRPKPNVNGVGLANVNRGYNIRMGEAAVPGLEALEKYSINNPRLANNVAQQNALRSLTGQ